MPLRSSSALLLLALCAGSASATLPTRATVLAAATRANSYFLNRTTDTACGWTRGTYMTGLMELWRATGDAALLDYAFDWAHANEWKLCGKRSTGAEAEAQAEAEPEYPPGPKPIKPKGKDDADNEICGATYAELFVADPARAGGRAHALGDLGATLGRQIAGVQRGVTNLWSWIDAIHMGMNAFSRYSVATEVAPGQGNAAVLNAMFALYNTTANAGDPPDGIRSFHMWSAVDGLFYRDDRFLGTGTFWGRGNGWAITAMARTLQVLPAGAAWDAQRAEYTGKLRAMAAALAELQGDDGCWRADLKNATAFPGPEMTGSANFVNGIAFGIADGILDKATYMPVLEKGYSCLTNVALQPSGLFGYCQPIGGSPAAAAANSTSDFCVGQFLLASAAVAKLAPAM